jgi:hypothetical protein
LVSCLISKHKLILTQIKIILIYVKKSFVLIIVISPKQYKRGLS